MKEVKLDFDKAKEIGISDIEYIYLLCLLKECVPRPIIPIDNLEQLKLLIDRKSLGINITGKGRKLFEIIVNKSTEFDDFCNKYRELFPKGVNTGGYPVRSNLKEIHDKFERFFRKYKDQNYSYDECLKATQSYLKGKERENYSFIQTAKHFIIIKKPNLEEEVSQLATYIDHLRDGGDVIQSSSGNTKIV